MSHWPAAAEALFPTAPWKAYDIMKLATMKAQANRASALTMPMAKMLMPFVGDKILAVFILLSPFFR